jgi:hypothetical protein
LEIQASGRGLLGHWPERRWPERHWPECPGPGEGYASHRPTAISQADGVDSHSLLCFQSFIALREKIETRRGNLRVQKKNSARNSLRTILRGLKHQNFKGLIQYLTGVSIRFCN